MRLHLLLTGVVLCLGINAAHAQFSMGHENISRMERQRRQFFKSFAAAKEAGRDLNFYLRTEMAFGYALGDGYLRVHRHYDDDGAHYHFDSSFSAIIKPTYAFVVNECTGYPLLKTNESTTFILTYGLSGTIGKYDMSSVKMGNYTTNFTFGSMNIGIPVGLDLKLGGEANLDRTKHFCLTMGAGLEPNWVSGEMNVTFKYNHIYILPFAKVEAGFVTRGFGMKVRGTYMAARYNQFYGEGLSNGLDVKLSHDGQFIVSLVFFEMLKHWDD